MTTSLDQIKVVGTLSPEFQQILSPDALKFLLDLHKQFNTRREALLNDRSQRQKKIDGGKLPSFLAETEKIRNSNWEVASCPADLLDRRVEITGPVDKKMIINALNSGANVYMADFEDSTAPTWANVVEGQLNLQQAIKRTLSFQNPDGKSYALKDKLATLLVRPRGWHLVERHVEVDGKPISASLFDFGLYFYHNVRELLSRNTGPYFYIPKLESHLEARLWNDVFNFAQDTLQIPRGTIRATVLIETILAAFEMDEILYELKDHISGLNAGRWDYMFSMIKKCNNYDAFMLPDRASVTMAVPFMRAYCDLLVQTCHKRKAHAMGGMAAFIPSRKDLELNERALAKVREDKKREAGQGFDGTWVAHPDLVAVAKTEFDNVLGEKPNQKDKLRQEVSIEAEQLLDTKIEAACVTRAGLTNNISVALQYIESWLRGTGAVAIYNLMEDAATAEISRAQLWLWLKRKTLLDDGSTVTKELYQSIKEQELEQLTKSGPGRFKEAAEILDQLVLAEQFIEFLTLPAYDYLN